MTEKYKKEILSEPEIFFLKDITFIENLLNFSEEYHNGFFLINHPKIQAGSMIKSIVQENGLKSITLSELEKYLPVNSDNVFTEANWFLNYMGKYFQYLYFEDLKNKKEYVFQKHHEKINKLSFNLKEDLNYGAFRDFEYDKDKVKKIIFTDISLSNIEKLVK